MGRLWGGGQVPFELGGKGKVVVPVPKTTQPTQPPNHAPHQSSPLKVQMHCEVCTCGVHWYKLCLCQQTVNKEMIQDRKW